MTEAEMLERIHIQGEFLSLNGEFLSLNEENTTLVLQKIRELLAEQETRGEAAAWS